MKLFDVLLKLVVGFLVYHYLDYTLGDKEEKKRLKEDRIQKKKEQKNI